KKERTVFADTINALNSGLNNLTVTLETPENSIIMDYIEVIYEKRLVANENKLFITKDESSLKNYTAEGFSSDPYILNISNSKNPSLVSHFFNNGNAIFSTSSRKTLLQSSPYSIEGISLKDPTSLFQGGADWIVITDKQFIIPASRLKNWRGNHIRGISSPQTRLIEIDEIYDNFSYGVKDPSAIKRFLYWTQENWNTPVSYVLLFGDGSYDDKNLTGTGKTSFIPVHTEGTTIYGTGYLSANPSWDSWFVDFNEDRIQDIPIGRVTVSNATEGNGWADKLIDYEKSTGSWRMKAILLADDAIKSGRDPSGETDHTVLMEDISNTLPDWIYQDKIYLMEYTMSSGGTKPEAREDHLESMSDGALVGFYLGHGNLMQITDEKALEINDINRFSNWRKAPIYYFGSCEVGYFERPEQDCIGGKSNLYKDGGNIVSIAAGRATGYTNNGELGERIAEYLFNNSVFAAGDAFLLAKEEKGHYTYTFFGDPATSILIDSTYLGVTIPDTAVGGRYLKIEGIAETSADKIFCFINEAQYDTVLDASEGTDTFIPITIKKEGKALFRGSAPIINDSFSLQINIPYNIQSDSGRISLYSRGEKYN
ncbi:MAG: C25 family cysteine peptidase, partial [candidate division WOR-3 bacterium]